MLHAGQFRREAAIPATAAAIREPAMKNAIKTVLTCAWVAALTWGCVHEATHSLTAPLVPEDIRVAATEQVSLVLTAKGVQIYECRARKDDAARFEWVFKAPEADLFDWEGKKIGKHYAGPTWESNDGSKVLGEHKAHADARDANAIQWLLIEVKKHEGEGVFSKVTNIQRVDTIGGKAPAGGCEATSIGKEIRVPYTATYYFYIAKP